IGRPASSTLVPYTTLFRSTVGALRPAAHRPYSQGGGHPTEAPGDCTADPERGRLAGTNQDWRSSVAVSLPRNPYRLCGGKWAARSEEHTSELQSRENLVCR